MCTTSLLWMSTLQLLSPFSDHSNCSRHPLTNSHLLNCSEPFHSLSSPARHVYASFVSYSIFELASLSPLLLTRPQAKNCYDCRLESARSQVDSSWMPSDSAIWSDGVFRRVRPRRFRFVHSLWIWQFDRDSFQSARACLIRTPDAANAPHSCLAVPRIKNIRLYSAVWLSVMHIVPAVVLMTKLPSVPPPNRHSMKVFLPSGGRALRSLCAKLGNAAVLCGVT